MNQFVSTDVMLENGPDGATGEIALQYDPNALRFTSIAPGQGVEIVTPPGGGPESGRITLKLSAGAGSRRIVALTFQAVGSGPSVLGISSMRLANPQGTETMVQPGNLTIEILRPQASFHMGTTELPGWGIRL